MARGRVDKMPKILLLLGRSKSGGVDRAICVRLREVLDDHECLDLAPLIERVSEVPWRRIRNGCVPLSDDAAFSLRVLWEEHVDAAGFPRPRPRYVRRPRFEIGAVYDRRSIHEEFGGRRTGSISVPIETDSIFLFVKPAGRRRDYHDRWLKSGDLNFYGEGQQGDMQLVRGNLAVRNHFAACRVLHVFEPAGATHLFRYAGKFKYDRHRFRSGDVGVDGTKRRAIQFHLVPDNTADLEEDLDSLVSIEPYQSDTAPPKQPRKRLRVRS